MDYQAGNSNRHDPRLVIVESVIGMFLGDRFKCYAEYENASAQFGQPAYEDRSADGAVPDEVEGMCGNMSLPPSSLGRNSGLSLEIPNQQ